MTSLDQLLDSVQPREVTETVAVRGDLIERIRRKQTELAEALRVDEGSNLPDRAPALRRELDQLAEDQKADRVEFRFRSLPGPEWKALLRAHPPTDADRAQGYDYDPEAFPPEAMAACCVAIGGEDAEETAEGFRRLAEVMNFGSFRRLWDACLAANLGVEDEAIPFTAAAFGAIVDSRPNSTTAAPTEPPTASSSDE